MAQHPSAVEAQTAGLFWGIKRSFLEYVLRLPDADIALGDGAEILDSGLLVFPLARADLEPAEVLRGSLEFSGRVVISAHGGMLRVDFGSPLLEVHGGQAVLSVTSSGVPGASDGDRLALARLEDCALERAGDELLWSSLRVGLAEQGAPVFGGQYPVGQELDPLYVRLATGD